MGGRAVAAMLPQVGCGTARSSIATWLNDSFISLPQPSGALGRRRLHRPAMFESPVALIRDSALEPEN